MSTSLNDRLFAHGEGLAAAIRELPDNRLFDTVPGRDYNFYHLFHGLVQHSLYHGGQIAILNKAAAEVVDGPGLRSSYGYDVPH